MTSQSKPRRRFFRYSLRTMMLVVTLICVLLGITAKRAQDQKQAVEVILESGGIVLYQHRTERSDPPGPEWLRKFIGDEYFFRVDSVHFTEAKINEASLIAISRLTDMRSLVLTGNRVTDAGLEHLQTLTKLQDLNFSSTEITDAGLVHLRGMTELQRLFFYNTKISDRGVEHLNVLTNLRGLILNRTSITDEGARNLRQALPNCKVYH